MPLFQAQTRSHIIIKACICVVRRLLKGAVGGCALNIHGNYIVDAEKLVKNHGSCVFEFLSEPWMNLYACSWSRILLQKSQFEL